METKQDNWITTPSFYPPLGVMLTTLRLLKQTRFDWWEIEPDYAEGWSPNEEEQVYQLIAQRDKSENLLGFIGRLFDPQPDAANGIHEIATSPLCQTLNEAVKWCDDHAAQHSVDTDHHEPLN